MIRENLITVTQGDYRVSAKSNDVFTTVLGSCVSVCLFDPKSRVGGMNHFLLPRESNARSTDCIKYGTNAMEVLINKILQMGGRKQNLQAKLFGGASLVSNLGNIGEKNIVFAREFLDAESIECIAESLGGTNARRLRFAPTSGKAKLLVIPSDEVIETEVQVPPRPAMQPADITMF
ncbi:MAG: chemotaxis protein CheD [Pseudomonadota bacterium]